MRSLFTESTVTLPRRAEISKAGLLLPFDRATNTKKHEQSALHLTDTAATLEWR